MIQSEGRYWFGVESDILLYLSISVLFLLRAKMGRAVPFCFIHSFYIIVDVFFSLPRGISCTFVEPIFMQLC